MFQRGLGVTPNPDLSSAFFVFRSTGNGGASWNFPARPVVQSPTSHGEDAAFLDKQLMTVDNHVGSPFQDRVYVTWTTFDVDGTAYIYEAHSNDYAEHFQRPVLVEQRQRAVREHLRHPDAARAAATRTSSRSRSPAPTARSTSSGRTSTTWSTGADNRNQMLLAKSTDGGQTFSAPVKVGDYYDLPDCDTYQGDGADPGRACVPEKGPTSHSIFRATNYPSGAVNPNEPVAGRRHVRLVHQLELEGVERLRAGRLLARRAQPVHRRQDRRRLQQQDPAQRVDERRRELHRRRGRRRPAHAGRRSTSPSRRARDQWWQWAAFNRQGKLAVSYYDRQYGDDETTGYSDFSLSGSSDLSSFRA